MNRYRLAVGFAASGLLFLALVHSASMPVQQAADAQAAPSRKDSSQDRPAPLPPVPGPLLGNDDARPFYEEVDILKAIAADLNQLDPSERLVARSLTLTHLFNAAAMQSDQVLNTFKTKELPVYVHALSKVINSLSWDEAIHRPLVLGPGGTVLRLNLEKGTQLVIR